MKSYTLAFLICFGALAQQTTKPQYTARELFYSAAEAPPAKPAPKPATTKKGAPTHVASTPKPATPPVSESATEAASRTESTPLLPQGAKVIPAVAVTAPAPQSGSALGLRYTILKLSGGEMKEVAPDTVFHAGDRIQFNIETNGPGYLYIVSQGSSGNWRPMFPSAEVEDGNNFVEGFRSYTMPPKSRIVFDEQTGMEKIFIVFSRQPEPDIEKTIYSLQTPEAKPAARPQPEAAPHQPKQLLVATLDDGTVGRLRDTYSRDLIIERTDDNTPGDKKEKAVYVVNPTGSRDSRVVADLLLVHQ